MGYLTLPAPFDGVIVARNANTFDFVLPATGDPTAMERAPHLSPGGAAPIYVVDRTDIVRIFVDIPEQDANYVHIGTKATVLAKAYRDQPIPGTVTRTSWALNVKSRTLRAEIDLPNPDSQLLPGMYAYAKVIIERPGVRALPLAALTHSGDKTYCWKYENGHAVRTEIQTGVSDGEWIEVTNLPAPAGAQRRRSLGADQRLGAGDPGRPVDPRRWRPRRGCHRRRSRRKSQVQPLIVVRRIRTPRPAESKSSRKSMTDRKLHPEVGRRTRLLQITAGAGLARADPCRLRRSFRFDE